MQTNKVIFIILIFVLFCSFCTFELIRKAEKTVVRIISPTMIELEQEVICIPEVETFTSNLKVNQSTLENKYKLKHEDALKLGYLTDKFAEDFLAEQKVKVKYTKIKNQDCTFANIFVKDKSYRAHLINTGFALDKDISKQLEKARKLKLVILNHKSNKYHKLTCKYGVISHDNTILPEHQLPQNAKPCKFCHITKSTPKSAQTLTISNGNIKMYLTDLTTTLKPDNKCKTSVCQELLHLINSSTKSIDIALYGWGQVPDIYQALKQAKSRGVKIRIAYDISNEDYYPDTKIILQIADKKAGDTTQALMHNKFFIFDDEKLLTGSMNFSPTGLSGFNSNCIFSITSREIAQIYKREFEEMIAGKFNNQKAKLTTGTIQLADTKVTPFFSPHAHALTNNIIPLIDSAKSYIYIPTFILTHDELANALIRANKRNVNIKIITDATNSNQPRSKIRKLRQAGIPVKIENYAGKIHSKTIIIDDKYLIAGSMNFSNSGEKKNDENCLIIESSRFAKHYKEIFEYLWEKIPDKYLTQYVRAEGKESIGSCSDGIDNDYDGKIDMQDEACR